MVLLESSPEWYNIWGHVECKTRGSALDAERTGHSMSHGFRSGPLPTWRSQGSEYMQTETLTLLSRDSGITHYYYKRLRDSSACIVLLTGSPAQKSSRWTKDMVWHSLQRRNKNSSHIIFTGRVL